MKYVVIGLLWVASIHYFMGDAYMDGFEQGYVEGTERAKMEQGTTAEQCYRWWFGGNTKQFEHEMKQFCKRSDI
jgi:hypothetical protein